MSIFPDGQRDEKTFRKHAEPGLYIVIGHGWGVIEVLSGPHDKGEAKDALSDAPDDARMHAVHN
jgi:hypothetical protein